MVSHGYSWFLMVTHGFSWLLMVSGCSNNHCNKFEKKGHYGALGVTSVTKGNVHCRTLTVTVCEKIAGWSEL